MLVFSNGQFGSVAGSSESVAISTGVLDLYWFYRCFARLDVLMMWLVVLVSHVFSVYGQFLLVALRALTSSSCSTSLSGEKHVDGSPSA